MSLVIAPNPHFQTYCREDILAKCQKACLKLSLLDIDKASPIIMQIIDTGNVELLFHSQANYPSLIKLLYNAFNELSTSDSIARSFLDEIIDHLITVTVNLRKVPLLFRPCEDLVFEDSSEKHSVCTQGFSLDLLRN